MIFTDFRKISLTLVPILLGVIFFSLLMGGSTTLAQTNPAFAREVRVIEMDETGVQNPGGIIFSPRANSFSVMDGQKKGQAYTDLIRLTPFAERIGSNRIMAAIKDSRNLTLDGRFNRLLIFEPLTNKLIEVREEPDGNLNPRTLIRYNAQHLGLQKAEGLTVDPVSGNLFFLDAIGPRLVRVEPGADGSIGEAVISKVDLQLPGLVDVRGIAFDPATGHLHLMAEKLLYELSQDGQVVATRDLAEFGFRDPQGMVFAPSGDLTDDPSEISLYITDQGDLTAPTTGKIVELSFAEVVAPAATPAEGTLIKMMDTSLFYP